MWAKENVNYSRYYYVRNDDQAMIPHSLYVPSQATYRMIMQVLVREYRTDLHLTWIDPKYRPYQYNYGIKCRYICTDTHYLRKIVTEPGWSTSSRVKNVQPASHCTVHFFAIYNPASFDKGLLITHHTKTASEYNNITQMIVFTVK